MMITDATYQLFIGSNPFMDGQSFAQRLKAILDRHLPEGWTMIAGLGSWRSERETAYVVTAATDFGSLSRVINSVKDELNQESVGVIELPDMRMI